MKKTLRMKFMLLLFALVVGASNLWAEDETVSFPTSTSSTTLNLPYQVSGTTSVTVTINKNSGTAAATNTDGLRVYVGSTIQFSSSTKKIASIVFTYNANKSGSGSSAATPTGVNVNTGSMTTNFYSGSSNQTNKTATWVASNETTSAVTFTVTGSKGNYALKQAVVTFVEGGSTPLTPTKIELSGEYPTTFFVGDAFSYQGMVVTATYEGGSTSNVTSSATFTGYDMSQAGNQTVTVSYTSNEVEVTTTYNITVSAIPDKTIAQFISAGGGKCYLTGTVSNITNTTYGNFDLTDNSGTIFVYGCLTSTGQSGQFSTLNIEANDVIKVLANTYQYYNNTTNEAVNVIFVEEIVPNAQTLTVSATNGNVEITGKTLDNGSCEVNEGASVTATATPANHYTFTSWTAEGVTLADATANPLTFTMPTNDVTLTASFTENAKHNATFYVLGGISGTDSNVYEGDAITFPSVTAPNGYTFMGWTTSSIVGIQDDAPNVLVNSANMGNANIDYYAVFAIQTGGDEGTVELTNSAITNYKSNSTTSYRDDYSINNWTGRYLVNNSGNTYYLQLGYNASTSAGAYNSHLTTPLCANNITSITISTNKGTSSGRTFYLCSASNLGTASSANATYGYGSTTEADGSVTINVTGNTKQFHIYPNGTAYIASVTLTYSNVSYSSYCTTVNALDDNILPLNQSFELENDFTITTGTYYLDTYVIVPDGITLTVDGTLGNSDPDFLVIEDGGQLICNNAVAATLQKDITKYNNASDENGWYTIASPVVGASVSIATIGDNYDMFAYSESDHTWLNVKNGSNNITTFGEGQGFLYANGANQTLPFAGTMKASNKKVEIPLEWSSTDGKLKGFNLVGNPFTCNITPGMIIIDDDDNETVDGFSTYYVSEGNANLKVRTLSAEHPIKPGQGFFVQAEKANSKLIFNPSGVSKGEMDYKPTFISIEAGNSEFTDVAYIQLGYGNTLRKMSINDNTPLVYVMNDGADYAAAKVDEFKGSMPVCFKAAATGRYTISVNIEGLNMSYLHLIDRLTGEDVNLLLEPTYSFIATKGDNESRFILSFTANCFNDSESETFAYQAGNDIFVRGEGELQIFDVTGRMVSTTNVNGVETINVPSSGMYIFRLVGTEVKTQKIVVR